MADLIHRVRQDLVCFLVDPASGMLAKSSRHIRKAAGVAENLPFKDSTFEAVLIGDALHHFREPLRGIVEAMRILKPGGYLFIFDIDPATLTGKVIRTAEKIMREPARFCSPEDLGKLLEEYGFRVRIDKYDWRYSITGEML